MFNIVYRSLASPTTKQPDVEDILKRARRFNIDNEITGCLVYHKGLFIQYLEGNKNIVLELYSRIEKDVRHTDVTLLSSGYIYSREFDNWSMGYQNIIIANNQFKYLEFMVNPLIDIPDMLVVPNPTSKRFWVAAKKLINGNDS
jgi:hypothetical protein